MLGQNDIGMQSAFKCQVHWLRVRNLVGSHWPLAHYSTGDSVGRKIMNIGRLNIPKPDMGNVAFVHDIQARLYLHYSRLLENEGPGAIVLKALEKDPRVQAL